MSYKRKEDDEMNYHARRQLVLPDDYETGTPLRFDYGHVAELEVSRAVLSLQPKRLWYKL